MSAPVVPASMTPTPPGVGANEPARCARKNTRKNSVIPSSSPTPSERSETSKISDPLACASRVRLISHHGRRAIARSSLRTSATPVPGSWPAADGTRRARRAHNPVTRDEVQVSSRSERSTIDQNAADPANTPTMAPRIRKSVASTERCVMSIVSAASGSNHVADVVAIP